MMLIFHDPINPDEPVGIDPKEIGSFVPFGSGTMITANGKDVPVHETPEQVVEMLKGCF